LDQSFHEFIVDCRLIKDFLKQNTGMKILIYFVFNFIDIFSKVIILRLKAGKDWVNLYVE
jgi:hypothetical protein